MEHLDLPGLETVEQLDDSLLMGEITGGWGVVVQGQNQCWEEDYNFGDGFSVIHILLNSGSLIQLNCKEYFINSFLEYLEDITMPLNQIMDISTNCKVQPACPSDLGTLSK